MDFLLVLIELFFAFFARSYGWVWVLRANIDWETGFLLQRVSLVQSFRSPTNHSLCQKIRINVFYSIRIGTTAQVSFVLSQYTRLTDRLRDRRTDKNAFEIPCVRYIIYMQSQLRKVKTRSNLTRLGQTAKNRTARPGQTGLAQRACLVWPMRKRT